MGDFSVKQIIITFSAPQFSLTQLMDYHNLLNVDLPVQGKKPVPLCLISLPQDNMKRFLLGKKSN